MTREFMSAARRAAAAPSTTDAAELLAWVDGDVARARQLLRDLPPVDLADEEAVAARQELVDQLRAVFPVFRLDGVEFRIEGEMQLLDLAELMKLARRKTKAQDLGGMAALAEFFEGAMGWSEYERFREHIRDYCTDPDTLNDVMEHIVEVLGDRPTGRPSPSRSGPSTSGPTSRVVSLSPSGPVTVDLPPADQPDLLSMTPEQFAAWQEQQRARAASPLGVPTPQPDPTQGSVYFG